MFAKHHSVPPRAALLHLARVRVLLQTCDAASGRTVYFYGKLWLLLPVEATLLLLFPCWSMILPDLIFQSRLVEIRRRSGGSDGGAVDSGLPKAVWVAESLGESEGQLVVVVGANVSYNPIFTRCTVTRTQQVGGPSA